MVGGSIGHTRAPASPRRPPFRAPSARPRPPPPPPYIPQAICSKQQAQAHPPARPAFKPSSPSVRGSAFGFNKLTLSQRFAGAKGLVRVVAVSVPVSDQHPVWGVCVLQRPTKAVHCSQTAHKAVATGICCTQACGTSAPRSQRTNSSTAAPSTGAFNLAVSPCQCTVQLEVCKRAGVCGACGAWLRHQAGVRAGVWHPFPPLVARPQEQQRRRNDEVQRRLGRVQDWRPGTAAAKASACRSVMAYNVVNLGREA